MDVLLVTLGDPATLTGGYLYHRRMEEAAPAHGATLRFASLPGRPFPAAALRARSVWDRVQTAEPHVVVIDSIAAWAAAPWRRRLARYPLAAMIHQPPGGIDGSHLRRRLQAPLDLAVYHRASLLMVASRSLVEQFSRLGSKERAIEFVPPGRDVAIPSATIDPVDFRRGRRRALLCVANWLPRKGILELLDAFATLEDDLATLHLVGDPDVDPDYRAQVRRRMAAPNLTTRVVVHGAVPSEDVAAMYCAADVFVLPSFVEPYGTVYGEAMARGLPVVGWRAGNLPQLARDGHEGLMVETGDVRALAAALRRIATDEQLVERLSKGAVRRAEELPTWEQTAERFFSCLAHLARPPRVPPQHGNVDHGPSRRR